MTSPEDQVLRKLDWHRQLGGVSDRQWRVVGILRVLRLSLDLGYLTNAAAELELSAVLDLALAEAEPEGS